MKVNFNILDYILIAIAATCYIIPHYFLNIEWLQDVGIFLLLIGIVHLFRSAHSLNVENSKELKGLLANLNENFTNTIDTKVQHRLSELQRHLVLKLDNFKGQFTQSNQKLEGDISILNDSLNHTLVDIKSLITSSFNDQLNNQKINFSNLAGLISTSFENIASHTSKELIALYKNNQKTLSELNENLLFQLEKISFESNSILSKISQLNASLHTELGTFTNHVLKVQASINDKANSIQQIISRSILEQEEIVSKNQTELINYFELFTSNVVSKMNSQFEVISYDFDVKKELLKESEDSNKIRFDKLVNEFNDLRNFQIDFQSRLEEINTEIENVAEITSGSDSYLKYDLSHRVDNAIDNQSDTHSALQSIENQLHRDSEIENTHYDSINSLLTGLGHQISSNRVLQEEYGSFIHQFSRTSNDFNNSLRAELEKIKHIQHEIEAAMSSEFINVQNSFEKTMVSKEEFFMKYEELNTLLANSSELLDKWGIAIERKGDLLKKEIGNIQNYLNSNMIIKEDLLSKLDELSKLQAESAEMVDKWGLTINTTGDSLSSEMGVIKNYLISNLISKEDLQIKLEELKRLQTDSAELVDKWGLTFNSTGVSLTSEIGSIRNQLSNNLISKEDLLSKLEELSKLQVESAEMVDKWGLTINTTGDSLSSEMGVIKNYLISNLISKEDLQIKLEELKRLQTDSAELVDKWGLTFNSTGVSLTSEIGSIRNQLSNNLISKEDLLSKLDFTNKELIQVLRKDSLELYSKIESVFALYNTLKLDKGLPEFTGWAISSDFAKYIVELIINKKPKTIVSLGSGSSDIIVGRSLQLNNIGKLYSVEHLRKYCDISNQLIKDYDLQDWIDLLQSPIKNYNINNESYQWYDLSLNKSVKKIDLLIVDGPPGNLNKKSRYPAVPILLNYLKKGSIVLLDDGYRTEESQIAEEWARKYDFELEFIENVKGAYKLTKL